METGILAAVGANQKNNDIDVEVVQRLLNRVPRSQGAPQPLLVEDGDSGPLTIAGIRKFQRTLGFEDGVVEPFKTTHRRLIEIAGNSEDIPIRTELAEGFVPRVRPMIERAAAALEVLRLDPAASGPEVDRTRAAFKVHFLLDEPRDDQAGSVKKHFDGIRVNIDNRNLLFRDATIKQAKLELNERKTRLLPAIYANFGTRASVVFTPLYKPFADDFQGFGPQMLAYTLIVGLAQHELGQNLRARVLHSDTPGFPGRSFEEARENPAAYGGFAFQLQLGFALPLGESTRQL